jgi:hypothetical protein
MQRSKNSDRPSAVGDFKRLTCLDSTKNLARSLAQITDPYLGHVLFVAHQ